MQQDVRKANRQDVVSSSISEWIVFVWRWGEVAVHLPIGAHAVVSSAPDFFGSIPDDFSSTTPTTNQNHPDLLETRSIVRVLLSGARCVHRHTLFPDRRTAPVAIDWKLLLLSWNFAWS